MPAGLRACILEFHLDLPLPLNIIVKAASWVWQRITRVLLYNTYVGSHRKWNSRHQLGSRWKPLGDYLEYSLRLAQPTDHKPQVSKWWNCNAIKFAKGEIALYWRLCFGFPRNRVYSPYATGQRRTPVTQILLRGIGRIMALSPLVTAQFWLAIWSGLFVIDRDDRLSFRWGAGKKDEVDTA